MSDMTKRVARAITEAIRMQNVDPFCVMKYEYVIPRMDWEKVANAAIEAVRAPTITKT